MPSSCSLFYMSNPYTPHQRPHVLGRMTNPILHMWKLRLTEIG